MRTSDDIKREEEQELQALEEAKREGLWLSAASHHERVVALQQERAEAIVRERKAAGLSVFDVPKRLEGKGLEAVERLLEIIERARDLGAIATGQAISDAAGEVQREIGQLAVGGAR